MTFAASASPRLLVVGGGLVGLGTAYALQRLLHAQVTVCEKESTLGSHQSTHNSGVLHAGLYYAPGSQKAALSVRGLRLMSAFAARHGVPHEICGKLVVATSEAEIPRLRALLERGRANGLEGVAWMRGGEAREIEPHVDARAAVRVPQEGIIDYAGVVDALRAEIELRGGRIATAAPVTAAVRMPRHWIVQTPNEQHSADAVVNCGGLQSDRVARLFGARPTVRIVPFRGDYLLLSRPELVRHLVYPVPDPAFPFLGVHFTRMIRGGVECGPTAVLALDREGYRRRPTVNVADALDALSFRGLWRFLARHPRTTALELQRSMRPAMLLASLQRLVPELTMADLRPGPSGVRAQAMRPDGTLVEDFAFLAHDGALHVLNAPSPAATASLAIGEEIARRVAEMTGIPRQSERLEEDGDRGTN